MHVGLGRSFCERFVLSFDFGTTNCHVGARRNPALVAFAKTLGVFRLAKDIKSLTVPVEAEALHLSYARRRDDRNAAKRLTLVNIGNMHFDNRHVYRRYGVAQRIGIMRVGARVVDNRIELARRVVYDADQVPFAVRLKPRNGNTVLRRISCHHRLEISQALGAVNIGLAHAEHV